MPWNTSLTDLADGGTPTASQLNEYFENIQYLRDRPVNNKYAYEYDGTANIGYSGTAWGTFHGSFVGTLVTTGGNVELMFSAVLAELEIDVRVNGTRMGGTPDTTGPGPARYDQVVSSRPKTLELYYFWNNLAAGTHTFQMEAKYLGGATGEIFFAYRPRWRVWEH